MHLRAGVVGAGVAVLLVVLAGCSPAGPDSEGSAPASAEVGVPPPGRAGMTTLLEAARVSGSREVGSFTAYPGDLWIRGSCAGGDLELHLIPLAVLPIECDRLGDKPFTNQITLRRERQMSLVVAASRSVIWGVRVEQDQRTGPSGSPSPP